MDALFFGDKRFQKKIEESTSVLRVLRDQPLQLFKIYFLSTLLCWSKHELYSYNLVIRYVEYNLICLHLMLNTI